MLKELLKQVGTDLELNQEEIAFAAINLAIGTSPLLVQGDEDWISKSQNRARRTDKKDDRYSSRRRHQNDSASSEVNMERFRVEVGHRDRVKPGNIVGAIANEAGIQGKKIGRIQIFDSYSLIDLPKGMPEKVFKDLKRLKVMNKELQINRSL